MIKVNKQAEGSFFFQVEKYLNFCVIDLLIMFLCLMDLI